MNVNRNTLHLYISILTVGDHNAGLVALEVRCKIRGLLTVTFA